MNFPFFIAKRYLFSKKKRNAINIISAISVGGVMIGAMALIVILSVFNGLDSLINSLYNAFDSDLKITIVEGKTFTPDSIKLNQIKEISAVKHVFEIIEENVLLKFDNKQHVAVIKGVEKNYIENCGIDSLLIDGTPELKRGDLNLAVIGYGVAHYLSLNLNFVQPIQVFVPKRKGRFSPMNPLEATNTMFIYPNGIFSVQQDFDNKYLLAPIDFTRQLLNYTTEVSAIEIKLKPNLSNRQKREIKNTIIRILGSDYQVKNREEQREALYKIMQSEKWIIFFVLTFIMIIASFNIIGTISMLMIEKKDDSQTLQYLGASQKTIRKIFLLEGILITVSGALIGLLIGLLLCWLQIYFGIIEFPGGGTFIVEAYPVEIRPTDVFYALFTVLVIGTLAAWYPVYQLSKTKIVE